MQQTKFFPPRFQNVDANGDVIVGSLEFYDTGTTNKITTYSNYTRASANANPINADSNGRFGPIFFDPDDLDTGIAVAYYTAIDGAGGSGSIIYTDDRYGFEDPITLAEILVVLTQASAGTLLKPRTPQEEAAGIDEYDAANTIGDIVQPWLEPGVVERYGINVSPGTTAMQLAVQAAADQAKETNGAPVRGDSTYKLLAIVDFREAKVAMEDAAFTIAHSGIGIIIGGNSGTNPNPMQSFGKVTRTSGTDSTTTPSVRCIGAKSQVIRVLYTNYFQLYGDSDDDLAVGNSGNSSAYSSFHIEYMETLELATNASPTDPTIKQWFNENTFYLGRIRKLIIGFGGTYRHNNNQFWAGNFESNSDDSHLAQINIIKGHSNTVWCPRFEITGGDTGIDIDFAHTCNYNKIIQTWTSSRSDFRTELIYGMSNDEATITDAGVGNIVVKSDSLDRDTHIVGHADVDDINLYPGQILYETRGNRSNLSSVTSNSAQVLIRTKRFRVYRNDIIGFFTDTDESILHAGTPDGESKYRLTLYCFDADMEAVLPILETAEDTPTNALFSAQSLTSVSSPNVLAMSVGKPDASTVLLKDTIAWVYAELETGSGEADNALARSISVYVRRTNYSAEASIRNVLPDLGFKNTTPHAVTDPPTRGFAPLGYQAIKYSDGTLYRVNRAVDTTLSAGEPASETVLALTDVTGIATGDIIGIQLDTTAAGGSITDWTTVSSISGSNITVAAGLTTAAASGNRVVFLNWE